MAEGASQASSLSLMRWRGEPRANALIPIIQPARGSVETCGKKDLATGIFSPR